jgi:hypothetical protein
MVSSLMNEMDEAEGRTADYVWQCPPRILIDANDTERGNARTARWQPVGVEAGRWSRITVGMNRCRASSLLHYDGLVVDERPNEIGAAQQQVECIGRLHGADHIRRAAPLERRLLVDDLQAALFAEAIECVGELLRTDIETCIGTRRAVGRRDRDCDQRSEQAGSEAARHPRWGVSSEARADGTE